MKKKMYLVSQEQEKFGDRYNEYLFVTESYEKAVAYMEKRDQESNLNGVTEPMTYSEFERCNMGLPDGLDEFDLYEEGNNSKIDFEVLYAQHAIDRDGHTKEEFIEMHKKVSELYKTDWGVCVIHSFILEEPETFEYITCKHLGVKEMKTL